MPDGFTGQFYMQIQNAENPTLGQNGQGVCGVVLHFDHEYVGDLQITLTSPAGQSVTLVGPIGFFGETDFTTWNITFVPCGDPASPDPGFNDVWSNNQPWGLFGNYFGSYYPAVGCLENFNSGPVNGQWTLTVIDGQAIDVGNFYNYEIIFCDPSGINCFSCAANAGNLLQPDVVACEGSPSLDLNLPPTYTPPASPPPASEYGYTYVVGGTGGVIQGYEPDANLSNYPPGTYTVCGLSYLLANAGDLPQPDGSLTVQQLAAQLNSTTPPFCGKVTTNCVNVTINPLPPDIEEFQSICAPQCYQFYNQTHCQSGTYTQTLMQNGCPFTATLHLTVNQPNFVTVNETVCPGSCSQTPGFENACGQGTYIETFTNVNDCDSTVTLNLIEMSVIANIVSPPPQLSCNLPSVQLSGVGSSTGPGVSYLWTASNGGNILGSPNGISATVNAPGDYQLRVCRTMGFVTCCDSVSATVIGNQDLPDAPVAVTGPTVLCPGEAASYSVASVANAASYNWTVPVGVMIDAGQGDTTIAVTWNGSAGGNVCVTAVNACGESAPVCLNVQLNSLPAQAEITGDSSLCTGTNGSYTIQAVNGADSYVWTTPAGGAILSGQNTTSIVVEWANAPGGEVCVAAENACGTGPEDCYTVSVFEQPVANAGADNATCSLSTALSGSVSVPGSSGQWTALPGPGNAVFSDASSPQSNVTVNPSGIYTFVWTESNSICADADSVTIAFNDPPITGTVTHTCDGANQNYTVSFAVSGGTPPFVAAGGSFSGNIFTSDPIASGQSYSFVVTDANGCTAAAVNGSYNCNCTTNAGQMSGTQLTACEGDSVTAQHLGGEVLDADDVVAFVLHDQPGATLGTVFAQNTSGTFGLQNGMTYGIVYYISLIVGNDLNGAPDLADQCLSVAPGQPVIFYQNPVPDAGTDADTCGLVIGLAGSATNGMGQWSAGAIPAGASINFGAPQSPSTSATASLTGAYTLIWTVTENGCTGADTVTIQFNDAPALADLQRTCDAANENYTVTLTLSGGTPPYSINGAPVAGTTFTSAPIVNGQTYSFIITDANGCQAPAVTGSFNCSCTTNAGVMQADTLIACEDATVTVSGNAVAAVLDANDVTQYVLHNGSGPALGQIFDQNTSGTFGIQNGMNAGQVYYISLVVGNDLNGTPDPADPCLSVATGQPVIFMQIPQPDAGADDAVCGKIFDLKAADSGFSGAWSQISGPGNAVFNTPNLPACQVSVSLTGTYVFQWQENNGSCSGSDQISISFTELPAITALDEVCNAINTQYNVSFQVTGGTAPFVVDGLTGSFNGTLFTSDLINNNTPYAFTVTDANGCTSLSVSGNKNCNCTTNAGSMQPTTLAFCAGEDAIVVWNNNAVLDADDKVQFVLHDQSGTSLGTVIAVSDQPVFGFSPALQTNVTYFISAVAGNNVAGNVDLNDPCLSVASGAPVMWKPLPVATLSADSSICAGEDAVLTFSGTGTFPLHVSYTDATGNQSIVTLNNQQAVSISVTPDSTTTYLLISVNDGSVPVCSTQIDQAVSITVHPNVYAGIPNEPVELCEGTNLPLQLINFLTDADPGGQWAETSAVPSLPGGFTASTGTFETFGQPAGTYTFRYRIAGMPPCPDDEAIVTVKLLAIPVADAGENKAINCDQTNVLIGGFNTSTGTDIFYNWQVNGTSIGNTAQVFVGNPGTYVLTVSNAAGCSATDMTEVILDNEPPAAEIIRTRNIRCYGEQNGIIAIDSVRTNHPPVLFSLNGGPYTSNPVFSGLAGGDYTVSLIDANGCEWSSAPIAINEPPEFFLELGADVEAALGDSVYLKVVASVSDGSIDTIMWDPLLDSTALGKDFQRFLPLQSWIVHVTAIDTNGCQATDKVLVRVDQKRHVFIPNILNPGRPGNDAITVFGGRDVKEVEVFRIFDRWGAMVYEDLMFQPNDPGRGWKGNYRNKEVQPGVYVYYAVVHFIDGETETYRGDVTVFR
ncbi:MAG: proprotein convertase P-domain-containing protein [Saprospiraceae bacterium]